MLDNTVVNVALPSIQRDLGVGIFELQWIVTGYALSFAALMLTGGKFADLLGRRRIFVVGIIVFTIASLFCGLADSGDELIAWRIVQGGRRRPDEPGDARDHLRRLPAAPARNGDRSAGVSAMALAIGPLVGGLDHAALELAAFLINVPVGVLGVAASYLLIDESRDTSEEQRGRARAALVGHRPVRVDLRPDRGEHLRLDVRPNRGAFVLAAVSLTAFVVLELRQRLPMMDLALFKNGTFTGGNIVMLPSRSRCSASSSSSRSTCRTSGFSATQTSRCSCR